MSYLKFDKNLLIISSKRDSAHKYGWFLPLHHCNRVQYAKATWTSCHSHKRDEQ